VESEVGIGTKFHVYLPASTRHSAKEGGEMEDSATRRKRILVMDDDKVVAEVLQSGLPLMGYEVELAGDGAEALAHYTLARDSGQPFDAIIMDLTIPGGMGGKKAIKKLLEIDPEARAIVASGYSNDPVMADFDKHGFKAFISKPFTIDEMEKTLNNVLEDNR
jgi:DNA-binding NtrC family response regulator